MKPSLRGWWTPVAVGAAGFGAAAAASSAGGIPRRDALTLLLYSSVGAAVAGVVAGLALFALRRRSIGLQAAVASLSAVGQWPSGWPGPAR
jgi:hypothetical protein